MDHSIYIHSIIYFSPAGEHVKVGAGGHGEGAGLLLRQAARGGAAVPKTGQKKRGAGGAADGDPLRGGRAGRSTSGTGLFFQSRGGGGGGGGGWDGVRRCGYVMCGPTRERPLYLC